MYNQKINAVRFGSGKRLLLIHGLGGSWRSWNPVIKDLSAVREVIAIDLPGFGDSARLAANTTMRKLADAVETFIREKELIGIDVVGISMGARLALELARRGGLVGAVIALAPAGFWNRLERVYFFSTIKLSRRLIGRLKKMMPNLTKNVVSRSVLFSQFSIRPWNLSPQLTLDEMSSFTSSLGFNEGLRDLTYGEALQGMPAGSISQPLVIGWGKNDHVCLPKQAKRALKLFPDAHIHWFNKCGHFPHWDSPKETVRLILGITE
jgi:pimeloyl-ACP methyl ester carboxylesterase